MSLRGQVVYNWLKLIKGNRIEHGVGVAFYDTDS